MKKILMAVLLALGYLPAASAAGTCSVSNVTSTQNVNSRVPDAGAVIVSVTCTGDAANGSYPTVTIPLVGSSPSGTLLNAYNLTGFVLYQVGRTPGTTNPTANYSVTVTDAKGFAVDLGNLASNGSASAAQLTAITSISTAAPVIRSALTVAITGNSVNSATITLDLIFRTTLTAAGGPGGGASFTPGTVSTVASATTISPTTPLVIISGTAAIATITLPAGFSTGCIDILATGAWTTTTAGNIQAIMTATPNVQYRACYFGTKWNIK